MKVLLFSDSEIWDILKLLAAVLHIGNVKYRATVVGKLQKSLLPIHTIFVLIEKLNTVDKILHKDCKCQFNSYNIAREWNNSYIF